MREVAVSEPDRFRLPISSPPGGGNEGGESNWAYAHESQTNMAQSNENRLPPPVPPDGTGEIVLYRTQDGRTRVSCRFDDESVWLTQAAIADLFQTTTQNITLHIGAIYQEGELREDSTCKEYLQVRQEGARQVSRRLKHYNLNVILAVGYRVRSPRGTQFRQWATAQLEQYLVKGFAMDDERLKQSGGGEYFDELLARIRDIRSSERVFWRKVLDIYATSVDYDASADASQRFFAVVQNKMHWAAHGHTAAEVIAGRADSTQPNMGLTTWTGSRPRRTDVGFAKNYLSHQEIETLNLIVSAYLDFAELQARSRKPMTMRDWIAKLDSFLKLSDRDLLTHAGTVSHDAALAKAQSEYDKFRAMADADPRPVDLDFENAVEQARQIAAAKGKRKPKKGPEQSAG